MEKTIEDLNSLLSTPNDQPVDSQLAARLCDRAPTFLLPVILQLRHPHPDTSDEEQERLVNFIALSIPEPARTRLLIDPEGTGRYDTF